MAPQTRSAGLGLLDTLVAPSSSPDFVADLMQDHGDEDFMEEDGNGDDGGLPGMPSEAIVLSFKDKTARIAIERKRTLEENSYKTSDYFKCFCDLLSGGVSYNCRPCLKIGISKLSEPRKLGRKNDLSNYGNHLTHCRGLDAVNIMEYVSSGTKFALDDANQLTLEQTGHCARLPIFMDRRIAFLGFHRPQRSRDGWLTSTSTSET